MRSLVAVLGVVVGVAGCESIPAPRGLTGWNIGDRQDAGPCEARLLQAGFFHSTAWNLDVSVEMTNTSQTSERCGWQAQLISSSNQAVTDAVGTTREFGPAEQDTVGEIAAEANLTGYSGGPGGGEWVLMTLTHGLPLLGQQRQFHSTPQRVRPPG